jgi:ferredoxin--NADP+ reductase
MHELEHNATLVHREDLNDELSIVRAAFDTGPAPPFEPGQYATLGLPPADEAPSAVNLIRRAYSIASPPSVRDYLEFIIVRVPEGELTPILWTVEEGGRLWMDPTIRGTFTLKHAPADADLIMVCTGTGIGPFMSMLRHYGGQSRWRRFVLVHGVRRVIDMGYRQEVQQICRQDATVLYIPIVSQPEPEADWQGLRGRVQAVFEPETYQRLVGGALEPDHCRVFLCGNPKMIADTMELMAERGFNKHTRRSPGNLFVEEYWQ